MHADTPRQMRAGDRLSPGEILQDRYRVERELGRGRLGLAYLAREVAGGQAVVLKVFRRALAGDPEFAAALSRRAAALGALGGQEGRLVRVQECLRAQGERLVLVTEHVSGTSLRAVLEGGGRLAMARVLRLSAEIAAALQALHEHGLVHGDIRPEHVLLVGGGEGEAVKLKGLEIEPLLGTAIVEQMLGAGALPGAPAYTAPELIEGGRPTPRTDIYSYGVLLYEMVTGYVPFEGSSADAVLARQLQEPPVPPRALRDAVPPVLQARLLHALQKDPEERPRYIVDVVNPAVVQRAAEEHAAERAVAEGPGARLRQAGRRLRAAAIGSRRRALVLAALAASLALALGAVWGLGRGRRDISVVSAAPPAAAPPAVGAAPAADPGRHEPGAEPWAGTPAPSAPAAVDTSPSLDATAGPAPRVRAPVPAAPRPPTPRAARDPAPAQEDGSAIIDWLFDQPR